MGFVGEMIENSMDLWEGYLSHPFLQGLVDGTLPEEKLRRYIVQDSLYLREYARVFALGLLKAERMRDMSFLSGLIAGTVQGEYATRDWYLRRFGMTEEDWESAPLLPENRAYVDYMLREAKAGGLPEVLAAVLPCMLSYCFIGRELKRRYPEQAAATPYRNLIEDYANEDYYHRCLEDAAYTDALCESLPPERKARLKEIFRTASVHEMKFWDMSWGTER